MKIRFKFAVLSLFLALAAFASPLFAQDPVVSVTVKNLETLSAKLTAAAEDIGDRDLAMGAAAMKSAISEQAVKDGIDTASPVGVFLFPNDKNPPIGVAVVPVKDIEKVLKLIPAKFVNVEKKGENSWVIKAKNENEKFSATIERQGNWCFVQDGRTNISIADCGAKLVSLLTAPMESDFQVKFYVNAIPQNDRKEIVTHIISKAQKCLEKKGEKKFGKELTDRFRGKLAYLLSEAERYNWESPVNQASVSYTWDTNGKQLVIRNTFTGKNELTAINDLRAATAVNASALNGFGADGSLAFFHLNTQIEDLNDSIIDQIIAVRNDRIVKKIEGKLGEETAKQVADWLTNNQPLFRGAFLSSEQEVAGAVFAEPDKKLTVILARSVPDGYALEKTFNETMKFVCEHKPAKCKGHVKNGKRTEDGDLHIYQAEFDSKKMCCEMKKIFPETVPACVIFAPKAVYWAVGTDAVDTLVKNIQASKTADAPALAATVSLQKALSVCCKVKRVSDEKKAALTEIGDANVKVQVISIENGAEVVTEIPAQVFQALWILK